MTKQNIRNTNEPISTDVHFIDIVGLLGSVKILFIY